MGEEQQKKVDRVIKRHFHFAPGFKIFWLNGGVCGQCLYGESLNGWKRGNEGGSRADCGGKYPCLLYISSHVVVCRLWCTVQTLVCKRNAFNIEIRTQTNDIKTVY